MQLGDRCSLSSYPGPHAECVPRACGPGYEAVLNKFVGGH